MVGAGSARASLCVYSFTKPISPPLKNSAVMSVMSHTQAISLAKDTALLSKVMAEIAHCPMFNRIDERILERILQTGDLLHIPAKEMLIPRGEKDHGLFILISGSLQTFSEGGLARHVNNPGDIVGERRVFSVACTVDVYAETNAQVIQIPLKVFTDIDEDSDRISILASQEVYRVIASSMAAKLEESNRQREHYEDTMREAHGAPQERGLKTEDILHELLLHSQTVETAPIPILLTSPNGELIKLNQAAQSFLKHLNTAHGKTLNIASLVNNFDVGQFSMKSIHAGASWQGEWRTKDKALHYHVTISPVRDAKNTIIAAAYIFMDISVQNKQAEDITHKNQAVQRALQDLESTYKSFSTVTN